MLNRGKIIVILTVLILVGCEEHSKKSSVDAEKYEKMAKSASIKALGNGEAYNELYNLASDTISNRVKFGVYQAAEYGYTYKLDSFFVVNSTADKLVGLELHFLGNNNSTKTDGIQEFYGVKIEGEWYFWGGGSTPVSRKNIAGHDPNKELSYSYLHKSATYGGYLDKKGRIRDEWFEKKFKNPGYGTYEDRYLYKSTLDGKRIDNEDEFWKYIWKKRGLADWQYKLTQDSIKRLVQ